MLQIAVRVNCGRIERPEIFSHLIRPEVLSKNDCLARNDCNFAHKTSAVGKIIVYIQDFDCGPYESSLRFSGFHRSPGIAWSQSTLDA